MRVRPRQNGWLFPVMVVAAASVVAFGALGLAVVTGYLHGGGAAQPEDPASLVTAQATSAAKPAAGNPAAATLGSN